MMFDNKTIEHLKKLTTTPYYYYNTDLLNETLRQLKSEIDKRGYLLHYALKANANTKILKTIRSYGFGADCVSGNEVVKAITCGFNPQQLVFAGVGKSDDEINIGINNNIFCFNCESVQEMEVINQLAANKGVTAKIAIRINPNVDAHTHHYITTGLEENKFGLNIWELEGVLDRLKQLTNLKLISVHFHIGSQITDLSVFRSLCIRVNELQSWFEDRNVKFEHLNVGGGLGVNYHEPDKAAIPDFNAFFNEFETFLELRPHQKLHFELGRALVAQCGSLITRVLYVKNGVNTNFAIVDAGMTDLIRPALYQAYHKIENLTSVLPLQRYDVVGPICESSDCFAKAIMLPETQRGDLIAIRTAGAYGEIMASQYNLRKLPRSYYSDEL